MEGKINPYMGEFWTKSQRSVEKLRSSKEHAEVVEAKYSKEVEGKTFIRELKPQRTF